jgi:acetolactate decarboxylase
MPIDAELIAAVHVTRARRDGIPAPDDDHHALFQVSTIDALLEGRFEGELPMSEVLARGDHGLGTLDGLDGEMLILDGVAWQGRMDGTLRRIGPDERTPFAVVMRFQAEAVHPLAAPADGTMDLSALQGAIDALLPDPDLIYGVRVEAEVASITVRSVPKQEPPYPPLNAVTAQEAVMELPGGAVTIVGFRRPSAFAGIGVPGFHLHAADAARAMGGHVLAVAFRSGTVAVDHADQLHLELPAGVSDAIAAASDEVRSRIASAEEQIPGR